MANKNKRPFIQNLGSPVGQKMLNDQLDWVWGQLMGRLPEKALSPALQGTINSKATQTDLDTTNGNVTTLSTEIKQAANVIRLAAGLDETDDLGVALETVMSEIIITPERITAEVTNKSVHVGPLPPTGDDLYEGKLWQDTLTDEQLRWKGIVENSARSYAASASGASVSITDLSDDLALDVTVKTVAAQAGTGTPSPTNIRAISGKATAVVSVGDDDYTLTPDATLYGVTGYEDEIGNDGDVVHKTKPLTLTGFETWTKYVTQLTDGKWRYNITLSDAKQHANADAQAVISSHHATATSITAQLAGGYVVTVGTTTPRLFVNSDLSDVTAFTDWLKAQVTAGTPVTIVYPLQTPTTATVSPVAVNGVEGTNTVTSDGASVVVAYTGSGWALVSANARKVYASSSFTIDETGATVHHILLDGVTPYEAYTRLYGGGLEIYDSDTDEFIGGLRVVGGKVVLAASAMADPRQSSDFAVDVKYDSRAWGSENSLVFKKGTTEIGRMSAQVNGSGVPISLDIIVQDGKPFKLQCVAASGASIDGGDGYLTMRGGLGGFTLYESEDGTIGYVDTYGHLYPIDTGTQNLGTTDQRWRRVYSSLSDDISSDARLKQDITDLPPDLIYKLRPRQYRLKADPSKLHYGLIAQEVKAALDECGIEDADLYGDDDPDSLSLRYMELLAPMAAAVIEQKDRIDELERKLNALTNDLK